METGLPRLNEYCTPIQRVVHQILNPRKVDEIIPLLRHSWHMTPGVLYLNYNGQRTIVGMIRTPRTYRKNAKYRGEVDQTVVIASVDEMTIGDVKYPQPLVVLDMSNWMGN